MCISAKLIFSILEQSEESIQFFNLCTMYILCLIFIGITLKKMNVAKLCIHSLNLSLDEN